jgi:hypothetical protein
MSHQEPHASEFDHDGHRFRVHEHTAAAPAGEPQAEPWRKWVVTMDGAQVLEFTGPYPYRDSDVRKRILEWYGTQKAR